MSTDVQAPFLGTPLVPLEHFSATLGGWPQPPRLWAHIRHLRSRAFSWSWFCTRADGYRLSMGHGGPASQSQLLQRTGSKRTGQDSSSLAGSHPCASSARRGGTSDRHRLNGYLAHRVPSLFLASSFRNCLDCAVLKGMFPRRTRYPSS